MMPTEAMRLDAEEEEAARGAVEHLLKTLERDAGAPPPPLLGKLPAHDAPPVEPKGLDNGKVENMPPAVIKCEPEEHNGNHCNDAQKNGARSPVQNGTAEDSMEDNAPSSAVKQEPQNEEDVSCVLSNVLDEVENNVVSRDPAREAHEETNREDVYEVIQEVVLKVEDLASEDESKENVDTRDENITAKSSQEKSEPILVELEKPDKEPENTPEPAQLPNAPVKLPAIPKEKSPKVKKSKSKAKVVPSTQKPVETSPHEELDSVVSKCMSNMCDVLDSVDSMMSSVETTPPPKASSKKEAPVIEKQKATDVLSKKSEEPKPRKPEVEVPKKKDTANKKKEKEKAAIKLPPKVPMPPEKAKRKPRKKAQQPLVAPVLPFPTYFPPPPMMVPPPPMPLPFSFPTPVPVDLSVGKKKVQKVAPISSMSHMMPVATTSLADQVLDLSFKPQSRLPSEKKVKPIKRLSKKALQSVFHPYVDQADLMRMAAPLMPPPPAPAASVSPSDSRRGKKVAQHNSFMQAPPKPTSPFVFQIEEYHVGVAPNGTKVYNCDVCSSSYQRQFSLKRHYLRTHVNARLLTERDASNCNIALGADTPSNATDHYRCHLCAAVFFARRDKLVAHLALHPIDAQGVLAPFPTSSASGGAVCAAPVGPPSQVFSCDACATTFTSRVNLLKHEALHQVQDFPCFYCFRVFASPGAREKHHQQHTNNDNQQPCMFLCGKTFRTLQELRSHLQSMHNKEYFGCWRCNERFLDHAQLDLHARMVHSGPVHEPPIISITPIIEQAPMPPPPPPPPPPSPMQKQPPQSAESSSASTSTSAGSASFKYSCSDCSESFPSYVSMCKHRRSTHGTVGKHTKAASPQKAQRECTPPPPQGKQSKTVMVYLESKEEHDSGQKTDADKFSYPKLASGKQTVALTSEVTISALPPEEEEEMEEVEQLEVEPNIEELVDQRSVSPPPQEEESPAQSPEPPAVKAVVDKKKPELKLTVKLNFGKKTAKSKNVSEVIKKQKKVPKKNAVLPKTPPKAIKNLQQEALVEDVEKQTEQPVEQEPKKAEPAKFVQAEAPKSASDGKKVDSAKVVPEIKIQLAPEPAPLIEAGCVVEEPAVRQHPKKFLSRNRERSPLNREDLSHLSLSTQAAVKKRNSFLKRKQAPGGKKNSRKSSSRPTRSNPHTSEDLASFLQGLDLGMSKYHAVSAEKAKKRGKKLLLDDSVDEDVLEEGFTGDWIRPRRYICHICRGSFTELWDLDDHVVEVHTNIWCTYMDVDATTALPDDIFVRSIDAKGLISDALVQPATDPTKSECTKCGKISSTLPDLHTHMLECGGDTTWMLNSPRKKKQWRPFGTRRRARRGMKRIPSSPVKLNRTNKKLDGDSIQKMIANLPSKRGSRRVINFNDDDIKTRSQATIHSLRPAGTNQSKTRLAKQQLPRGRPTSMALAERRISSELVKTATKPNKQTAKSLPLEAPTKPPATDSQAPIVVKFKSKKTAKKSIPVPETDAPAVVAVEPTPVAPVEEAPPAVVEEPPVDAVETPLVEEAAKINKYAATKCHFCEKGLLNYFSLIRHLKCCPKNPDNQKEETVAASVPSPAKEDSQAVDVVKACPLCYEVFSSSKLLERHASSCCESPTEIGNRKKLFRRRPSEVSVSSKKSETESVKSSVSDVSKGGKRRKKGKSKPFYLKKKLMYKAKNNHLTLQMLTKKFEVQDIPEKSKEVKVKRAKKKYSKRKSELENLALPIIAARDEAEMVEGEEKSKKELPKKLKKSLAKEDLVKPDQSIESQLAHLAPEKPVVPSVSKPSVSDVKQSSEKVASSSDDGKQKKMFSKASKKLATAVEPSKSVVEVKLADDTKRKRKSELLKETPVTEMVKKSKNEEVVEKKKASKPKEEKKKGRKSATESQPDVVPEAVPKENPVEKQKDPLPEEPIAKSKSKSKKSDVSKPQVVASRTKHDEDEELTLSQIMKLKKAKKTPDEPEEQQLNEVISSPEPSLPKPAAEPVKPKKEKKSVGKAEENKSEPAKKKAKIDEQQSEKRPSEDSQSDDSPSPKKKRGRRSDEKEQYSTFCKICGTGYSTAFNYHKHLKSMKHLKHVLASEDVSGPEPSSRGTSPLPPSPSPYPAESPDRTLKPGDQIEVDEEEKDDCEEEEEIFFPFIKEGTPPPECPPPPPPSPCSPPREDDSSPPSTDVQQTLTVQDTPKTASETTTTTEVVKEFDDDEDEDWMQMQPTQLPPQPKWDFDAVRDSVSSWSNKATFEPPRVPPPPAEPVLEEEPKSYEHVLGGIVNQFINSTDDFEEPPERPLPQEDVLLPPPNPYLMVNYEGQQSFDEIQLAMGATNEEMAMLENLGGAFEAFVYDNSGGNATEYEEAHPGSSATLVNLANTTGPIEPLENADLMDLDNQVSEQPEVPAAPSVEELQPMANKYAAKPSVLLEPGEQEMVEDELGQMVPSNSSKLLSMYEQREMVCPMCNKHFLGLQALETHISWAHKVKDPKTKVATDTKGATKSTDQVARDRDCLLVGLAAANMLHHAGGMRSGVLRAAAGAVADECAQKKRKIACFVCKELYTDMVALNAHIRKQHVKSRSEQAAAGAKENGLKQQMTTALGGLLDRALTSMLTKVPLPPVDKPATDGDNMDETAKNWDDSVLKSVPSMHINMDPPLTLTAIAKKAIKPVAIEKSSAYDGSEPEMSKAARLAPDAVITKRKRAPPKDPQRTEEVEKPPPLFPENFVTPSTFDPILPEPQGSDMQCPICLGAVKHFHSLCRHLKTQHTEWATNTFNTDLFHYLILKRENPLITINKKYSIYIPVRANQQQHLHQQEQAVASTSAAADDAGGSTSVPEETPPSIEEVKEDDVIRQKAFAALQQLSTKKSVRGSKRRPLDLSELATLEKDKEAAS